MLKQTIFNQIFVFPFINLLILFYVGFSYFKIPGAFGLAIIALTALIRLVLQPFFHKQMETARKMQELKPRLDELAKRHKEDKARLQQEQLKLYQQEGLNPASGCLYMLIQIPVFIALYRALFAPFALGSVTKAIAEINKVLYSPALHIKTIDFWFFGFNLAQSPNKFGLSYYLIIPLITGFLQYYQVQVSTPPMPKQDPDKKGSNQDDFQRAMNTQMKFIFPILIAWFAYTLPVGLSLYWNVFSIFSIIQYQKLRATNEKALAPAKK